jgi:hypothetical protein
VRLCCCCWRTRAPAQWWVPWLPPPWHQAKPRLRMHHTQGMSACATKEMIAHVRSTP